MNRKILEMSLKNMSPNNIMQTKESIDDLKQKQRKFLFIIRGSFSPGETKVSSICVIPNKGNRKIAAFTAFL